MNARAVKARGSGDGEHRRPAPALAGCGGGSEGNTTEAAAQSGTRTLPQSDEPSNSGESEREDLIRYTP